MKRVMVHVDMDAFFASVEQLDNPELRGKPVAVGQGHRGVISAASYEIREYGVHSAMPVATAKRLCPHGIFLPGRMSRYKELSRLVMAALADFSPVLEQASVDEAYLDASGTERLFGPPAQLALSIKKAVLEASGLTCSVGVAPVKYLAKIASDMNKPDGYTILKERDVEGFLRTLPVGKIPGVGKKSLPVLTALGIVYAADVLKYPEEFYEKRLGKWGRVLHMRASGRDPAQVVPHTEPKSVSAENTFNDDTLDREVLNKWLMVQSERVGADLRRKGVRGRTVSLKIKYADFKQITRNLSLDQPTDSTRVILETAKNILAAEDLRQAVRLIGVGVSNFGEKARQLSLLEPEEDDRDSGLDQAVDAIRQRFGKGALKRAEVLDFATRRDKDKA